MDITKVITIAKKQKWISGSTWEFDLYLNYLFVDAMAHGTLPLEIAYIQPVLDDMFLNTYLNDGLFNKFKNYFVNEQDATALIRKQTIVLNEAKALLKIIKLTNNPFNYDAFIRIQYNLSLLMASVSCVIDDVLSSHLENLSQQFGIEVGEIQEYIFQKSNVSALSISNARLLQIYKQNKLELNRHLDEDVPLSQKVKDLLFQHGLSFGWINAGEKGRKIWEVRDFISQLEGIRHTTKKILPQLPLELKTLLKTPIAININDNIAADLQVELDFRFQQYLKGKLGKVYSEKIFENLTIDEIRAVDERGHSTKEYTTRNNQHKIVFPSEYETHILWLSNQDYQSLLQVIQANSANLEEGSRKIEGMTACSGLVEGRAKIVRNQKDLNNFIQGGILVAEKTQPSYVVVMKKAKAIVTDIGGITSHAAIVSREFNIPCVVGTGNATKIIKDQDFIRVDANKGIIEVLDSTST